MTGLPTVQVLLDNGAGSFPYDITSKCLLGPGISYSRGRGDWQDAVTAGSLTLTLNNSDGRFTVGSTTIGSPSPIRVDQRIRVKETVNGTTYTRFTGYVKSWPVSWPATVGTFATTTITVTDAQARAERRPLRSVIEEEVLADSPDAYYTLGEAEGATTAGDSSGNQASALVMAGSGTDVVFGTATGAGTDGRTGATFAGGKYLWNASFAYASTPAFIVAFATTSAAVQGIIPGLYMNAGALVVSGTGVGTGTYNDGLVHVVGIRYTATTTADVYIDAALTDSGVGVGALSGTTGFGIGGPFAGGSVPFTGSAAQAAVFNTAPSGARMIAESQAMLTGFSGESGTDRITRLAGYADIPVGTLDTSLTNVAFTEFSGRSAWDAIADVSDAEVGAAYVDASGNLTFHNRSRVSVKTAPDLTISSTYVVDDIEATQDDQQIVNYLEATAAQGTGAVQVARNTLSELGNGTATNPGHGRYDPGAKTYLVTTDQEVLDRANWIVANYAEPATRYGTLTLNLYAMPAAIAQSVVAGIDVDTWLRVTSMPSQNPGGATTDLVVEGYSEQLTATSWTLTCNVVSRALFNTLILDNATYGVLDSAVARLGV